MSPVVEIQSPQQMRCPTCLAEQVWSDECRRCKCDLRLVRSITVFAEHTKRRCLQRLRAAQYSQALSLAELLVAFDPAAESQQLLAVCHLHCGNLAAAVRIARQNIQTIA